MSVINQVKRSKPFSIDFILSPDFGTHNKNGAFDDDGRVQETAPVSIIGNYQYETVAYRLILLPFEVSR